MPARTEKTMTPSISPCHTRAMTAPADRSAILSLAARHDLDLDPEDLRVIEAGLDFRVAIGRAADGQRWVLRMPRRPDVLDRAEVEGRLLELVAPRLSIAVPDWRIRSAELIAYPLLPGEPGLTLAEDGTPQWHVDVSSTTYSAMLGQVIAQLHAIDVEEARATGVEVRSPQESRQQWRDDIARVADAFEVSPALLERWTAWVDENSYWPGHSVLTHGEIYPAHTLVEGERLTAVLDWTTAGVGDPARDLTFQQAGTPPEAFATLLEHYEAGGGRTWPRLAEHCAEMFAASPIAYGVFVLETGDETHRAAAEAGLNPPAP